MEASVAARSASSLWAGMMKEVSTRARSRSWPANLDLDDLVRVDAVALHAPHAVRHTALDECERAERLERQVLAGVHDGPASDQHDHRWIRVLMLRCRQVQRRAIAA